MTDELIGSILHSNLYRAHTTIGMVCMKSIPCMKALCVVLLSCCITFIGCSDSPETNNQSSGTLPANWQVRDTAPPSFIDTAVPGKWYLFNIYTINSITPSNTEYLRLEFEGSYYIQLPKVYSQFADAGNFRAWVFIPDAYIQSNHGVSFTAKRPDGKTSAYYEEMNLSISSSTIALRGKPEYYFNSILYPEDESAREFRKIIRSWEDVSPATQTITVPFSYDIDCNSGALWFQKVYTCKPDATKTRMSRTFSTKEHAITLTGGELSIQLDHLATLSATTENAINNYAAFNVELHRYMYNPLALDRARTVASDCIDDSIQLASRTMEVMTFATLKYMLSTDAVFNESVQAITLSSLSENDIPAAYYEFLPMLASRMLDIQTLDIDGDGEPELCYDGKSCFHMKVSDCYLSESTSPSFGSITNYNSASSFMEASFLNAIEDVSQGDRIILRTSSGKYVKLEIARERAMTLDELNQVKNGTELSNPIDVV